MVSTRHGGEEVPIERVQVSAYTVPTDAPESDGTFVWNKTTLVLVEIHAGGKVGTGYTYADVATGKVIESMLADVVLGRDALNIPACWHAMIGAIRNLGRPGISSMAIAAVDTALWDLKARLLNMALVTLLGAAHEAVPIYGSGGFTAYSRAQLQQQLGDWAEQGIQQVKMKVGRDPQADPQRVAEARQAIGEHCKLFVDANGAYSRKEALTLAQIFASEYNVTWFEEPVSSDDLAGLHLLRDRAPVNMEIAAGEYGYSSCYFRRMLEAEAVDVLQADATRCAGITGFLQAGVLCAARSLPLSAHCAPSLHAHACCAIPNFRHMEYFHDHVRIEHLLFDGVLEPVDGKLYPDRSRPGMGLEFKRSEAEKYAL
ncbi:MAG TPA: enolase C-terminal domain-like protein [Dictyobacter sp.]|nr:enolase C-terminal domain-like protein [Dictyobacter sp.]